MTSEELGERTELPDALRVLLDEYPAEAWERHPNFGGLIRFWLERHLMFRRVLAHLENDTRARLDNAMDAKVYASRLSRLGGQFLNELHGHHMIEDSHYFPHLKTLDARLSHGFEILDKDHHAIDAHLHDFAQTANAVIGIAAEGGADRDAVGKMEARLKDTARFLDRHLIDEEELVVPVLLKFAPSGLV